jgi:hypothetical protein
LPFYCPSKPERKKDSANHVEVTYLSGLMLRTRPSMAAGVSAHDALSPPLSVLFWRDGVLDRAYYGLDYLAGESVPGVLLILLAVRSQGRFRREGRGVGDERFSCALARSRITRRACFRV